MRRCAVSFPSNIAEGSSRNTFKDFIHFLNIALGSLAELETQLILAYRLGYLENDYQTKTTELRKRTLNYIKYLNTKK